jgi:NADPH-dependent ferric siderophore reductase
MRYYCLVAFSIVLLGVGPTGGKCGGGEFEESRILSLIQRLGSKEPTDVGIHHELAIAGSQAVPSLVNALSSQDSWTRCRAAQSLGLIGDSSAVPALVAMAQRKEDRYESALAALGQIGGQDAAVHLITALPKESLQNQPSIIRDLGLIGDNRAIPSLCAMLRDSTSTSVQRSAAEALGRFHDPRSRTALQTAVDRSANWDVYRAAKKSLLQLTSGEEPANQYRELRKLVEIVVEKSPEPPEGAEQWLRNYDKAHPPSPKAPTTMGPTIHSFVMPARYKSAREELLHMAEHPTSAGRIVEALLTHMRHSQLEGGQGEKAMRLIIDIGRSAVPALENAARRGHANANRCLRAIETQAPSKDITQVPIVYNAPSN